MLYALLMLVGGSLIAMQGPINAALSKETGQFEASLINFIVGAIALALIVVFFGKGHVFRVFQAPWWQWTGGLLGSLLVFGYVLAVPKVGVLTASLAMICGNLIMAAVIDNFGWFGATEIAFTAKRALGLALVAGGFWFVFGK